MALRDQPYFPLYVQDYLTDEKLNMCSASTQGIYIKMLCVLHKQGSYGSILFENLFKQNPKQNFSVYQKFAFVFAKQISFSFEEITDAIEELIHYGVIKITENENELFQPRMKKDGQTSIKRSISAKNGGGNPKLKVKKEAKILFKQKDKQNTEYVNEYEYVNDNKIEKVKKQKIEKLKFGEFQNVRLTEIEFQSASEKYGKILPEMIEKLSSYLEAKGDKYKSHYATFSSWVFKSVSEENKKNNHGNTNTNTKGSYIFDEFGNIGTVAEVRKSFDNNRK